MWAPGYALVLVILWLRLVRSTRRLVRSARSDGLVCIIDRRFGPMSLPGTLGIRGTLVFKSVRLTEIATFFLALHHEKMTTVSEAGQASREAGQR